MRHSLLTEGFVQVAVWLLTAQKPRTKRGRRSSLLRLSVLGMAVLLIVLPRAVHFDAAVEAYMP